VVPVVSGKVLPTVILQSIYSKNMADFHVYSKIFSNLVVEVLEITQVLENFLVVHPVRKRGQSIIWQIIIIKSIKSSRFWHT